MEVSCECGACQLPPCARDAAGGAEDGPPRDAAVPLLVSEVMRQLPQMASLSPMDLRTLARHLVLLASYMEEWAE